MSKKAILIVSFGVVDSLMRKKTLDLYEQEVSARFTDYDVFHAYTSLRIREKIKEREGIVVDEPAVVLKKVIDLGYENLVVQHFGIAWGETYVAVEAVLDNIKSQIQIKRVPPLLFDEGAFGAIGDLLAGLYDLQDGQKVVFVGHGTYTEGHGGYLTLADVLFARSEKMYLGTIKNEPTAQTVAKQLKADGVGHVLLAPFLLTAGHHVQKDIKNDWANALTDQGFDVDTDALALAEYERVRHYFLKLLEESL